MELLINVPEERLEELEANLAEGAGGMEDLLGPMRDAAQIALEGEGVDPECIEISLSCFPISSARIMCTGSRLAAIFSACSSSRFSASL